MTGESFEPIDRVGMRLCSRCHVKRPVPQLDLRVLDSTHQQFRCKRVEHCDALLSTTPVHKEPHL